MNRLIMTIGIIISLFLLGNTAMGAGDGYYVQVTSLDTGYTYWANVVVARNTTTCVDLDHGFHPETHGSIYAENTNQGFQRTLNEHVLSGGRVREYTCGNEIAITGVTIQPTWVIAFDYTPGE